MASPFATARLRGSASFIRLTGISPEIFGRMVKMLRSRPST